MSLVSIKVANGSIVQHMGTILGRVGPVRLTCDYNVISVQLQLQLPTGTELGKKYAPSPEILPKFKLPNQTCIISDTSANIL